MEKMSLPFLASILRCFLSYFGFGPFERSKPLGVFVIVSVFCRSFFGSDLLKGRSPLAFFALFVRFLPKVFWLGPFERSNSLGVLFALIVSILPKVFWF